MHQHIIIHLSDGMGRDPDLLLREQDHGRRSDAVRSLEHPLGLALVQHQVHRDLTSQSRATALSNL